MTIGTTGETKVLANTDQIDNKPVKPATRPMVENCAAKATATTISKFLFNQGKEFIKKLEKLYKKNNPFKQDIYILNPNNYFYNKNKVKTYNISDNLTYLKERKQYIIPSNEYRLDRRFR